MKPLVSVYITTHNRGQRLITAVQSVLEQTYTNIEIIISDDGSKDDTPEIVSSLMAQYNNIKYVRSDIAKGANHARNRALELATGEFITGLDDDDIFMPERVEFFIKNWDEKYSFICDNFINSYSDNEYKAIEYKQKKRFTKITLKSLLFFNICSNQIFTRKERLLAISGFDESVKKYQDWDCWLRLTYAFGDSMRLNQKTYLMCHDSSVRVSNNQSHNQAYNGLVLRNLKIYYEVLGEHFVDCYLLFKMPPSIPDLFRVSSKREFNKVIKRFLSHLNILKD